ncbi:hypothetical protein [Crocosphaera sp. XPORK-15E]|uniref:hypothetical protein n=1 Tax=Crocosphaera sp. XPORK-15E TaxID=3110247 RepID=UPI002B1FF1E4|nr:hypothetical protein [Crocosphaera sp. XPORK-15E]MEA5534915.1 hypothetical protein [Crocosphaera sp. XPORK-15E]
MPSISLELNLSYIPMGNYHPEQPFSSEFEPNAPTFDPPNQEAINPEILPDDVVGATIPLTEAIAVSIVEDQDSPLNRDWFNLARKLRGQNRELLDTIVTLEQALAASRQQLQEQMRRSHQTESLTSEQTTQLQTTQAQNSNLLEQLQLSQKESQRQKFQIQTLQQQLRTIQETFAQLERECALLKEESQDKTNQLMVTQRQVKELQTRLQRQQRYTLQYKAALDECLSNCARKAKTQTITTPTASVAPLTPKIIPIQPWSGQPETPTEQGLSKSQSSTPETPVDPIDQTLEQLFSLTADSSEIVENQTVEVNSSGDTSDQEMDSRPIETVKKAVDPLPSSSMIVSIPQSLIIHSPVPFSFSIDRSKKDEAAKAKVDLPGFLPRLSK